MCGILGYLSVKENATNIDTFYKRLQFMFKDLQREGGSYNNIDATGYFHPYIGIAKGNYKAEEAIELPEFEEIKNYPVPQIFLGHVRKTTEGHPEENENNHPLWSDNYILIHNGTVDSDILDTDIQEKYKMPGTVDSNHILACLEEYGIDDFRKHLKGLAAIIFIKRNEENALYFYRDTRPIFIMRLGHSIWISSTKTSLLELAKIGEKKKTDILFKDTYPIVELSTGDMFRVRVDNGSFKYKQYEKLTLPARPTNNTNYARGYNQYSGYQGYQPNNQVSTEISFNVRKYYTPKLCSFCGNLTEIKKSNLTVTTNISCDICYTSENTYTGEFPLERGSLYDLDRLMSENNKVKLEEDLLKEYKITPIFAISLGYGYSVIFNKAKRAMYIFNKHLSKGEISYIITKGYYTTLSSRYMQSFPEGTNLWVSIGRDEFKIHNGRPYVEVPLCDADNDSSSRILGIIKTVIKEFEYSFDISGQKTN